MMLRLVSLCQQIGLPFRKTLPWRFPIIRHFLTLVCQFHDSGSSVSRLRARAEPSCPLAGPGAARPPRAGRVSRDPGRPSPQPVLRPALWIHLPKLLESTDSDSGASEPAELRRGRRQGQSSVPASAGEQPRSRVFGGSFKFRDLTRPPLELEDEVNGPGPSEPRGTRRVLTQPTSHRPVDGSGLGDPAPTTPDGARQPKAATFLALCGNHRCFAVRAATERSRSGRWALSWEYPTGIPMHTRTATLAWSVSGCSP
jgi:hypothetical protein